MLAVRPGEPIFLNFFGLINNDKYRSDGGFCERFCVKGVQNSKTSTFSNNVPFDFADEFMDRT